MLPFMKATFLQDLPTMKAVKRVLACDRTVSNWKTSAFQVFLFYTYFETRFQSPQHLTLFDIVINGKSSFTLICSVMRFPTFYMLYTKRSYETQTV